MRTTVCELSNSDFFNIIQHCIVHKEGGTILPCDEEFNITFVNTMNGLMETKTISRDDLTEAVFQLQKAFNKED